MNNVAFFVDGHLEKYFIQDVCKGKVVRMIGCNGKNVSTQAIAKRIASLCRLLGGRCYPIITCIDREDRTISADKLSSDLLKAIRDEGISDDIIIGVADKMIENWILVDKDVVLERANKGKKYPYKIEGLGGKGLIKKLIPNYHETTIGVELLKECRPSKMVSSRSFKNFYKKIDKFDCWWLKR